MWCGEGLSCEIPHRSEDKLLFSSAEVRSCADDNTNNRQVIVIGESNETNGPATDPSPPTLFSMRDSKALCYKLLAVHTTKLDIVLCVGNRRMCGARRIRALFKTY